MRTYKKDDFDYSKVAGVVVDMKPVDVRPGPVKAAGRRRSSIVSKPPDIECTSCQEIISFAPHIHCTECKRAEVFLCLACFQLGAEIGEHVRGHNYEVAHRCGPPVFKPAPHEGHNWGALEDQRLLSLIRTYKLDDWPKIAYSEFGRARSVEEALNHFSTCFMRSVIGEIAVEEIVYPPIHAFGFTEPELYTGEFFKPTPADELMHQIKELCEQIPDGRRLLYEVNYAESPAIRPSRVADDLLNDHLEEMICEFSHVHVEHNPAVLAELMYGRPKCFLVNRFTHLCKSPRQNLDKATPENMRALYLEHLNQTPRSRRFSSQPAADESEASRNGSPTHKFYDDHNVEAEEHSTRGSDSRLEGQEFNDEDEHPPTFFAFPPRICENGNSSPPQPKSPLRSIAISTSPTPPLFMNNTDDSNPNPPVLEREGPPMSENEESNQEMDETGSESRGSNRRRDTLSHSPPKSRDQSNGRVRRKRKLDEDHTPKLAESNGILRPVSNHVSPKINGHFRNPQEFLSMDEVLAHRLMTPYLHFVKRECPYLSKDKVRRFDPTDLSTLAYNPKRDDFEHDYRNGGELFISKIFLNGENLIFSEVELLKTAIRLAKVQRYNRILERRHCNHAIIREHQLLSEFFSIVKTCKTERGKYTIFSGESFPSRKRAEECRPYFAKMRRVLGSDELLDLAENIAKIEKMKAYIRLLQSLQASGQTELNGLSPNSCISLHRLRFVAHIAEALLLLFHFARLLSAIFLMHAQSCLLRSLENALPIDDEFDDGDPEGWNFDFKLAALGLSSEDEAVIVSKHQKRHVDVSATRFWCRRAVAIGEECSAELDVISLPRRTPLNMSDYGNVTLTRCSGRPAPDPNARVPKTKTGRSSKKTTQSTAPPVSTSAKAAPAPKAKSGGNGDQRAPALKKSACFLFKPKDTPPIKALQPRRGSAAASGGAEEDPNAQSSSSGRSKSQGAKQKASALEATNPVQPPKPQYDESQFFDIAEAHVADITDYVPPPVIEVRPEPINAVLPEVQRKKIVNWRKEMYNRGSANVPVLQNPLPVHEQPTVQSTSSADELPFHSHSATPTDRLHTPMGPANVVPAGIYESPRRSSASSHQTYTPKQHRPMVEVVQQPPHPPLPPQQQMPMHQPMVAPQTPVPTSPVVQRQSGQQQPMPQQPMQYVQYAPEQQQNVPMYPMNYMPAPNDQRAHQYPPQYPPHFVASSHAGYYPQQQQPPPQPPPQQMYVYRQVPPAYPTGHPTGHPPNAQHANVYPAYVRQAAPPPRQVVRIVRRPVPANMQPAPMPRHPLLRRAYAPRPMSNSPYCMRPPHHQYTQPTTPVQSAPLRQPLQVTPPMHRTPSPVVHYPPQSLVYYPNQPAVSHAYMAEQQRAAYQVPPYGYPPNVPCSTPYMPPPPPVERHEPQPQYVNQTPPAPVPHTSDTQTPMADLFEADNPDDFIRVLRVANDDVPVDSLHATATFADADFMSYFVPTPAQQPSFNPPSGSRPQPAPPQFRPLPERRIDQNVVADNRRPSAMYCAATVAEARTAPGTHLSVVDQNFHAVGRPQDGAHIRCIVRTASFCRETRTVQQPPLPAEARTEASFTRPDAARRARAKIPIRSQATVEATFATCSKNVALTRPLPAVMSVEHFVHEAQKAAVEAHFTAPSPPVEVAAEIEVTGDSNAAAAEVIVPDAKSTADDELSVWDSSVVLKPSAVGQTEDEAEPESTRPISEACALAADLSAPPPPADAHLHEAFQREERAEDVAVILPNFTRDSLHYAHSGAEIALEKPEERLYAEAVRAEVPSTRKRLAVTDVAIEEEKRKTERLHAEVIRPIRSDERFEYSEQTINCEKRRRVDESVCQAEAKALLLSATTERAAMDVKRDALSELRELTISEEPTIPPQGQPPIEDVAKDAEVPRVPSISMPEVVPPAAAEISDEVVHGLWIRLKINLPKGIRVGAEDEKRVKELIRQFVEQEGGAAKLTARTHAKLRHFFVMQHQSGAFQSKSAPPLSEDPRSFLNNTPLIEFAYRCLLLDPYEAVWKAKCKKEDLGLVRPDADLFLRVLSNRRSMGTIGKLVPLPTDLNAAVAQLIASPEFPRLLLQEENRIFHLAELKMTAEEEGRKTNEDLQRDEMFRLFRQTILDIRAESRAHAKCRQQDEDEIQGMRQSLTRIWMAFLNPKRYLAKLNKIEWTCREVLRLICLHSPKLCAFIEANYAGMGTPAELQVFFENSLRLLHNFPSADAPKFIPALLAAYHKLQEEGQWPEHFELDDAITLQFQEVDCGFASLLTVYEDVSRTRLFSLQRAVNDELERQMSSCGRLAFDGSESSGGTSESTRLLRMLNRLFLYHKRDHLQFPLYLVDKGLSVHSHPANSTRSTTSLTNLVSIRNPFTEEKPLVPNVHSRRELPTNSEEPPAFDELRMRCAKSGFFIQRTSSDNDRLASFSFAGKNQDLLMNMLFVSQYITSSKNHLLAQTPFEYLEMRRAQEGDADPSEFVAPSPHSSSSSANATVSSSRKVPPYPSRTSSK